MASKVNLTRRVKIEGRDRYCPIVLSANGKIKAGWVLVGMAEERHPGGSFYIDWTADGKRKRQAVGSDATLALNERQRQEFALSAKEQGIALAESPTAAAGKTDLAGSIATFLAEVKDGRSLRTFKSYSVCLSNLAEFASNTFLEDLKRTDLLNFKSFLKKEKRLAQITVFKHFSVALIYLNWSGAKASVGLKRGDRPTFTAEDPVVYSRQELQAIMSVSTPEEQLLWDFFLKSGMREGEVMHVEWRNVDFEEKMVYVKRKPEWDWKPKSNRERPVPVPDDLLNRLLAAKPKASAKSLIFPGEDGRPRSGMLRILKDCAVRAELDPTDFWLHKFRATFCTLHLRAGTDLSTVQSWAGHRSLASTMRYLSPLKGAEARGRVNAAF